MPRKPVKSAARAQAMQGNQNSVKSEEEKVPERKVLSLSFNHRIEERLRNALSWYEGYIPDDEEVAKKARELAYAAWDQYCASIEKNQERAIIL